MDITSLINAYFFIVFVLLFVLAFCLIFVILNLLPEILKKKIHSWNYRSVN